MIIDTSALIAILRDEEGRESIRDALLVEGGIIPTPVVVELRRVTARTGNQLHPDASDLLIQLQAERTTIESFTADDADLAVAANAQYGTGNGRGGTLNMLDLMVYGMGRRMERPILCTGKDFAATDIAIHRASRGW